MKRVSLSVVYLICQILCLAQTIENPVFDRTDVPSFHVDKIEITKDTTFVYCTYYAEENSWANISPETYLEDVETGKKYTILGSEGLPFGPTKRDFESNEKCAVRLLFPSIICTNKLNFIENPNESAFNIYGIDLQTSFTSKYTENDIDKFRKLAEDSENTNDWKSVLKYTLKQLDASKYIFGNNSNYSAYAMFNLTNVYFEFNDYDNVIEWGDRAIDILNSLPSDTLNLDALARTYGNVSTALHLKGLHDLANQYQEKSLTIRRYVGDGMNTLNYEQYLQRLARDYYYEENYPKALLYGIEVANIYEKKYRENCVYGCDYILSLNNLCEYYMRMAQNDNAVKCGRLAFNLIENGICEYSLAKCHTYNNLAGALISNNQIEEGINMLENILEKKEFETFTDALFSARLQLASSYLHYKKDTLRAIDLYKYNLKIVENNITKGKRNMPNYTAVLSSLYKIYKLRDGNIAKQYLNKLINIQKKWNGEESIAYANLLLEYINDTWSETLISKKDVDVLLNYMQKATIIIKRHYNNAIYNMSKSMRKEYWQRYKDLFTWLIPTTSILDTKESNSLAYDATLFYKGMLLTSDKELKDVMLSSKDSSLVNVYNDYIKNKSHIEEEYNHVSSSIVIDSLKKVIQEEEYLLSQKLTRLNIHNKGTDFTWKDVKEQLKNTDIAIEFVSYELLSSDIHYDAYVIKKDYDSPLWIPLCFENELLECFKKDYIDYERLSIVIWKNLQKEMEGVSNVYFSTSGLLNTIGIEYLPIEDNKVICDKYNLYRLSSTRALCMQMSEQTIENVCLYGGLDYNNMINDNEQTDYNKERISRSFLKEISQRGGFEQLVGSEQETEQIRKAFLIKSINCFVLSGKEGTEGSFKKLNKSRINIIHMSTHGMYVSSEKDNIIHNNNFSFILSDNKSIDQEDKALSRSFLVMSGGNMLIHRDSIPQNSDDGILTALEISHLDFKDLNLVVLSACQTGLGDIDSEGVYGFQRAFKKAGANTILMSLDKVDDEATKILMVEFYRNLMSGKTKHQSLKDAQKYLRSVDNGKYDDPKYWASFIMLDGLN